MAPTRFYLTNSTSPYTPTAKRGAWDDAGATGIYKLGTSKEGASTGGIRSETNASAEYDVLVARFVSAALPAGYVLGSAMAACLGITGPGTADFFEHLHVWITQGDSDSVRAVVLGDWIGASEVPAAAMRAHSWTGSDVEAQAGDRLVVEVGVRAMNTTTSSQTATVRRGGTGDDATDGAAVTTAPWIEVEVGAAEPPPPPDPPVVTEHPQNITKRTGMTASFASAATGEAPLSVQWQVATNGVDFSDITGATDPTYSFTVAGTEDGYLYRAVWTNADGTDTSDAATLTLDETMRFLTVTGVPAGYGVVMIGAAQALDGYGAGDYSYKTHTWGELLPRPVDGTVEVMFHSTDGTVAVMVVDDSGFLGQDYYEAWETGGMLGAQEVGYNIVALTEPFTAGDDLTLAYASIPTLTTHQTRYGHLRRHWTELDGNPWVEVDFEAGLPVYTDYEAETTVDVEWPANGGATQLPPANGYDFGFWISLEGDCVTHEQTGGTLRAITEPYPHDTAGTRTGDYYVGKMTSHKDCGFQPQATAQPTYHNLLWFNPDEWHIPAGGSFNFHGGAHINGIASYQPAFDMFCVFDEPHTLKRGWINLRVPVKQTYYTVGEDFYLDGQMVFSLDPDLQMELRWPTELAPEPIDGSLTLTRTVAENAQGSLTTQRTITETAAGSLTTTRTVAESAQGSLTLSRLIAESVTGSLTTLRQVAENAAGSLTLTRIVETAGDAIVGSLTVLRQVVENATGSLATTRKVTEAAQGSVGITRTVAERVLGALGLTRIVEGAAAPSRLVRRHTGTASLLPKPHSTQSTQRNTGGHMTVERKA